MHLVIAYDTDHNMAMSKEELLTSARRIAETGPNIAYISRTSAEYVRRVMRGVLTLIDEREEPMRNRIELQGYSGDVHLGTLESGQMFQHLEPADDNNVYMRIGSIAGPPWEIHCVLLTTGHVYTYPKDKRVAPLRRGRTLTITQG